VTVMLDPPGPPRAQVLKRQREILTSERGSMALVTNQEPPEVKQPGFSIISRFPNAANLKERNLAEAASTTASRVLHDFQPRSGGSLSRLSTVARVLNNKNSTDSSAETPDDDKTETASTVTLPNRSDNIQCNEVSSTSPTKLTPKLSRELSALQLSTPCLGRTRSSSDPNSDTENEAPPTLVPKVRRSLKIDSKVQMEHQSLLKNNPHFLRSKEAKVKKAASLPASFQTACSTSTTLMSAARSSPTTVMSLRPRQAAESPNNRKRKPELSHDALGDNPAAAGGVTPSKSPKLMPPAASAATSIVNTKPVMTRSRTARVLQLKPPK